MKLSHHLLAVVLLLCASACGSLQEKEYGPLEAGTSFPQGALHSAERAPAFSPGAAPRAKGNVLDELLDGPVASHAFWGACVKSADTGETVFTRNEERLFVPASNMKLLTTAVGLIRLGPDFTYTTNLYARGKVEGGVLKGDLVLRGSGDSTISDRFQEKATTVFEEWAGQLKRRGIRRIDGDVIGDDSLFDGTGLGAGWSSDDEIACYAARPSAVSFNDNCLEATIAPGKQMGQQAVVTVKPETGYVKIRNAVVTAAAGDLPPQVRLDRAAGSREVTLSGRLPAGSPPYQVRFSAGNPTLYAVTVLKEVLVRSGIRVDGRAATMEETGKRPDYGTMTVLASYRSPPLSTIIRHINKRSKNLYADLLFRTLGTLDGGGGRTEKAVQVMKETLVPMGIPEDSLAIYDGSGLSRMNLLAPRQVVKVLDYMSRHPYFPYFYNSLPVAGVDGTLMQRMKWAGPDGRVRAKTGTLTHTVSLSGYLRDRNDRLVIFSLMSNNCLAVPADVRLLQDAFCERLLDFHPEHR